MMVNLNKCDNKISYMRIKYKNTHCAYTNMYMIVDC